MGMRASFGSFRESWQELKTAASKKRKTKPLCSIIRVQK
jgi:hypothetical protein